MTQRRPRLDAVAQILTDYREGEVPKPTAEHVDRWVSQFDADVQMRLLEEVAHVFKHTYFSRSRVRAFLSGLVKGTQLSGADPCAFWRGANVLGIQQRGQSQAEITGLFEETLNKTCGFGLGECGSDEGAFVYLDDGLFSGLRIGTDIAAWIANTAPPNGTVHVIVIAAHSLGEWLCLKRLREVAAAAGKRLELHCWAALRIENRKFARHSSEVLWPAGVPDEPALKAYMAEETKFPFVPRHPGVQGEHGIFSSEDGRALLEREFLLAGMRIRSVCQSPSRALRPLGFSSFGLGFGSMILTFRNCPNNAPLALWWGDPDAPPGHPFATWYPLLPRKTYEQGADAGAIAV